MKRSLSGLNLLLLLAMGWLAIPQTALGQTDESETEKATPLAQVLEESEEIEGEEEESEEESESLRIVVTGEEGSRYVEPNATTGTRTDTPLRDIPQSIQVIPQEVLEDQRVIRLNDALRNVSGVVASSNDPRGQRFTIRGFDSSSVLRDGFRLTNGGNGNSGFPELSHIEQIEVLKGPAAILFGAIEPGGAINLVSEQPLSEPAYEALFQVGNRGLVEGSLDAGGPLTEDGRVRYRLNVLYRDEDYFRDFTTNVDRFFIAPVLSWDISDRTDLTLDIEYRDDERPADFGLIAIGDEVADIPFDRPLGELEDIFEGKFLRTGYNFEHRFSDNWKLRNAFHYTRYESEFISAGGRPRLDEATGDLLRNFISLEQPSNTFEVQTNIVGEFSTGSIDHTLLTGFDFYRREDKDGLGRGNFFTFAPINIFNPVYGLTPRPDFSQEPIFFDGDTNVNSYGFYVQDQIELADNLNLLAGIRYETFDQEVISRPSLFSPVASETNTNGDAFSPRLGVVYQPIEPVSLFASYSRSFIPNTARTVAGDIIDPEEGEQFEVGARTELLDGRFVASVAYFDITKQNVSTPDPNFSTFSIASGEQRSQGIEVDLIGELLPGWNLVANYAYTDTEITEDNSGLEGNELFGVPENNVNLWTTYDVQSGPLEGLGFGIGFNVVGERFGDNANSFILEDYFLTNAAVSYQRDNWEIGLNVRNLFDQDYIESAENSRTAEINPGEGFTLIGSFAVNF
ncbi:hypothetical protein N836_20670 [Leptolyngbya sp. Heron Island J]|uniref:TonB-dependent siderophore receptor n=1 Tax=Leptolyngbya sp. Heron Island J TaxID=1385935 RepID=UPI0003B9429B|nr:TonB-dependent siderophore receptor [Leptolyngbya sp. Heron Island J]ESA33718.1 hypothetical protein N836_20670 [Leptolyngbya sp. Heron Island J]